jgi:hypothetical protein
MRYSISAILTKLLIVCLVQAGHQAAAQPVTSVNQFARRLQETCERLSNPTERIRTARQKFHKSAETGPEGQFVTSLTLHDIALAAETIAKDTPVAIASKFEPTNQSHDEGACIRSMYLMVLGHMASDPTIFDILESKWDKDTRSDILYAFSLAPAAIARRRVEAILSSLRPRKDYYDRRALLFPLLGVIGDDKTLVFLDDSEHGQRATADAYSSSHLYLAIDTLKLRLAITDSAKRKVRDQNELEFWRWSLERTGFQSQDSEIRSVAAQCIAFGTKFPDEFLRTKAADTSNNYIRARIRNLAIAIEKEQAD